MYDKHNYLYSCRVYLPEDTALEYREYVDHEEEMRNWLKENTDLRKVEKLLLISPSMRNTTIPINLRSLSFLFITANN